MVGQQVGPVSEDGRQHYLQKVVLDLGGDEGDDKAGDKTDRQAAQNLLGEVRRHPARRKIIHHPAVSVNPGHRHQDQGKNHHRRPVVEKTLALGHQVQTVRKAKLLENRDHRDRVGRGNQRPEQKRHQKRHLGTQPAKTQVDQSPRYHHRKRHPHHRQHQDRTSVTAKMMDVEVERSLEKQRRKKYREHQILGKMQTRLDVQKRKAQARDHQRHRVRQAPPPRHERNPGGNHQ